MVTTSTPDRLMDAALKLFADNGYKATTVGAIESAAGLAPRSGALYQHFKGKRQLLEAAVDRELAEMDELAHAIAMFPLGNLRAEFTMLARWNLASLERRSALTSFVRREGDMLPKRLRTKLYDRLVARPYAVIVAWLGDRFREAGVDPPDVDALALILIESMGAYRDLNRVFGQVPAGVDDERFIAAWVEAALAVAHRYGLS
ncbi:MAG: TetR/AcrR family transcriptional regulator [Mycobacteriaceae bacterium]|nr:TetR/AcrR family transcriptional regulator [Mycobacteriaceae bacterium]